MTRYGTMAAAYLAAAVWADCGDEGRPPSDAEFSPLAKARAYIECRNLIWANEDLIPAHLAEQAGHDLWLTRNGHGCGFWDRPEIWGEDGADTLTRCAKSMGSRDLVQGDDGLLYLE